MYIYTSGQMTKLQIIHFILWGVFSPRDFTVHRHSLNIMQNIEICFLKCAITTEKRKLPIVPYFICALITVPLTGTVNPLLDFLSYLLHQAVLPHLVTLAYKLISNFANNQIKHEKKNHKNFMQSEFNTKYIQLDVVLSDVVLSTTNHFTMKQLNMKCSLFL